MTTGQRPAPRAGYHGCPGGCGRDVANHLFACSSCWWRLPVDLRNVVTKANARRRLDPKPHLAAMAAASRWYRAAP